MFLLVEKLVLDSSVFISAFGEDNFSNKSKELLAWLRQTPRFQIIIPAIAIAETIVNLRRQDVYNLRETVRLLLTFKVVPLDIKFIDKFYLISKRSNLKTSDLIIAAVAKINDAILISWDKKHLAKSQKTCKALSPSQFLKQLGA